MKLWSATMSWTVQNLVLVQILAKILIIYDIYLNFHFSEVWFMFFDIDFVGGLGSTWCHSTCFFFLFVAILVLSCVLVHHLNPICVTLCLFISCLNVFDILYKALWISMLPRCGWKWEWIKTEVVGNYCRQWIEQSIVELQGHGNISLHLFIKVTPFM